MISNTTNQGNLKILNFLSHVDLSDDYLFLKQRQTGPEQVQRRMSSTLRSPSGKTEADTEYYSSQCTSAQPRSV